MSNTIVSVRLPESMVKELNDSIKKDHYLDLSEAIRSIVRKKWMEWKDPRAYQIKQLREDIKGVLEEKKETNRDMDLLSELEKIRDMIKEREVKK